MKWYEYIYMTPILIIFGIGVLIMATLFAIVFIIINSINT